MNAMRKAKSVLKKTTDALLKSKGITCGMVVVNCTQY